jgi:hypothetical protein
MDPKPPDGGKGQGVSDAIGELWFESAEAMDKALKSAEMSAAAEDTKRFLDMTPTYAMVVDDCVTGGPSFTGNPISEDSESVVLLCPCSDGA